MTISELKFLVDVGVGKKVENYLHEHDYDTKTIRAINPRMSDQEIIKLATNESRMVITMDKDFGELVYHSLMDHCGIILLRLEDATGVEKLKVIKEILTKYPDQIKDHFCVYQRDKFRIRKIRR
jgi:predicted nuclease of predicted toxin-antitoxin system